MATYYDSTGRKITLSAELGKGGEGSVYAVAGDINSVGKIYHKPLSNDKAEKLGWMAVNQSQQLLKVAAWVTDTLHDRAGGRIVGFLMPSVKAKEVHELYSPKSRRDHFPTADWRFLIHAAINLARAFNNVHEAGHVIGDVNHGNCVVLPNGTVKLIDCDSYNIQANGKNYPCEVGVSTHIAPELQGKSLRGAVRTRQHDNFGLAVILFQILFLGRHPFAGRPLGKEERSLEDCIREQRFAYGTEASLRQIKQPPGTLDLEAVSLPVAQLFERAFLRLERPAAREWIHALKELSDNLTRCGQNSGHHFWKSLKTCPWCALEKQTGLPLFPVSYQQSGQSSGFNIVTIEQLLHSIQFPQNLPAKPRSAAALPPPNPQLIDGNKKNKSLVSGLLVTELAILLILPFIIGFVGALICGLAMTFIIYRYSKNSDPEVKKRVDDKFNESRKNWLTLEREWQQRASGDRLIAESADIKTKINDYKKLDAVRLHKLKQLDDQRYERQLEEYLDKFYIERADIRGIGLSRVVTLQSYGIETAFDVDGRTVMAIPGFGPTYTQKLLMWKEGIKLNFVFNPNKIINPQDRQKVEMDIAAARLQLEKSLQHKVSQLRAQVANINAGNQYLLTKAQELSATSAQAQSDKAAVGNLSWAVGSALFLAVTIPAGGGIARLIVNRPSAPAVANVTTTSTPLPGTTGIPVNAPTNTAGDNSAAVNANLVNSSNSSLNQNAANLSGLANININSLTDSERKTKAEELFKQGVESTKVNNYSAAEKFYRAAIKFDDSRSDYYHELGYALYRLKKFRDAAPALQKSFSLGSTNSDTRKILGLTYIELKKWSAAQEIFADITRGGDGSFADYYNLGTAAANGGNYQPAIAALRTAVQMEPNNAKAHFELGRSCHKFGLTYLADEEYKILSGRDPKLAEQLRHIIDSQ